eukprot:GABV01001365.1.p1 GENE.GABV01001365.1~~GABV01001365.1.p1  ORF type:complete len:222 (-),score=88.98 GABV01001365.1:212-877(-)
MTEHGYEAPDFFPKLYRVLKPHIFFSRYRNRLFELLDVFLSSKYLPEQLAVAFAKRLARLALASAGAPPPGAISWICVVVFNLVRRFPGALGPMLSRKVVVSHTDDKAAAAVVVMDRDLRGLDPFKEFEEDPLACQAMESPSLWEMATCARHYDPSVANLAKTLFLSQSAPKRPFSVDQIREFAVNASFQARFDKEIGKRKKRFNIVPAGRRQQWQHKRGK